MNFKSLIVFLSLSAEKKKAGLFEQITKTHGTIIGITSGIVLVLLIISILVLLSDVLCNSLAPFPFYALYELE